MTIASPCCSSHGLEIFLRINGRATLSTNPVLLQSLSEKGLPTAGQILTQLAKIGECIG